LGVRQGSAENEASFSFDRIAEEQREWLNRWRAGGGIGCLTLGDVRG